MMNDYDTSTSGYLTDAFEGISQTFTDIEVISTSEVNVVAKAKRYGRWWLLKGLRKEVARNTGYQQRLRKELEILMQLQHPGVVATYGIEDVEGYGPCIIMEYVEGLTLKEWLKGQNSRESRMTIARHIIETVAYIHSKGIVHRDLKPENIIVVNNASGVKLIDFGLADTDSHAILKQPAGTLKYMSPEQMQTAMADVRNDIYSIGVILQQMRLGGRFLYIINRCMKPIEHRYQNATELLGAFCSVNKITRKAVATMVALLLIVLLILIGIQMGRYNKQEERMTELSTTYQQEQNTQQQLLTQLSDSIAELKAYNKAVKDKEASIKERRWKVKAAVDKGYVLIEKAMRQTNIDQHLDTLSDLIYIWPDFTKKSKSGFRVVESYQQQIKSSFNDAEMKEISDKLNQHCADIIEKWNHKIIELSR